MKTFKKKIKKKGKKIKDKKSFVLKRGRDGRDRMGRGRREGAGERAWAGGRGIRRLEWVFKSSMDFDNSLLPSQDSVMHVETQF